VTILQHRTTSRSSTSSVGRYAGTTTQGCWQTLPIPITIPALRISYEKNPVFDGRVHIDLSTYHSLDESQKEMLKEHGLIVNPLTPGKLRKNGTFKQQMAFFGPV